MERNKLLDADEATPVLQIEGNLVRVDADGYFIFRLPVTCYIQRMDGQPVNGMSYTQITIYEDGTCKVEGGCNG